MACAHGGQYQAACIAPQFLTLLLAAVVWLHRSHMVAIGAAYAAALNLDGGVVNLFVFVLLFRFPKDAVLEDASDGADVYVGEAAQLLRA